MALPPFWRRSIPPPRRKVSSNASKEDLTMQGVYTHARLGDDGKPEHEGARSISPKIGAGRRATMTTQPVSTARQRIGDLAPKLVELTEQVLFGDVWERAELAKRDRSLVTVAALIVLSRPDQLRTHLGRALDNGVTKDELVETITHLAFYAGWPAAMSAATLAKEVFAQRA
jgi:4-carboxymuconolactone decarboxylase